MASAEVKKVFPTEPMDSLYHLCFQHCVSSIAELASTWGEQVAFVFDRTAEFSAKAFQLYNRIADSNDFQYHDWLGPIPFESMRNFPALQAADLVAYETYKYMHNSRYDVERPIRKSVDRLRERLTGQYWDEKSLIALKEGSTSRMPPSRSASD